MDYYRLRQDRSKSYFPEFRMNHLQFMRKDVVLEKANTIANIIPLSISNGSKVEYIDMLDIQLILFSEKLMDDIYRYERDIISKDVPLIHYKTLRVTLYKLPIFRYVKCKQSRSQQNILTLESNILPKTDIFRTQNMNIDYIIASDKIVDSIDWNKYSGIIVEKAKLILDKDGENSGT